MKIVGRVQSLWRYPVKSMRGEELSQAFAGFGGVYGDRCWAFLSSGARKGFPYITGREKESMLPVPPAAIVIRIRIRDSLTATLPAIVFFGLNLYILLTNR